LTEGTTLPLITASVSCTLAESAYVPGQVFGPVAVTDETIGCA
jgi:hypothetical protein